MSSLLFTLSFVLRGPKLGYLWGSMSSTEVITFFEGSTLYLSVVVLKTDIQLVEEESLPLLALLCSGSRAGTGCSAVGHSSLDK